MRKISSIENRIEKIKAELISLGEMHPGSISQQYNVCGVKNCRCKDKENPQKHGPYYQLSFTANGKSSSRFIKEENLAECKKQIDNYQRLKNLTAEWKDASVELAKEKLAFEKLNASKKVKV